MLDQLKKKRLSLTHGFDQSRPRVSSVQKRKQIQANLQQFKKDVQESKNNSRSNSPFQSAKNLYAQKQHEQQLAQSPTMKDLIDPLKKIVEQQQNKKNDELESPRFKLPQQPESQPQHKNDSPNLSCVKQEVEKLITQQTKNQADKQNDTNSKIQLKKQIAPLAQETISQVPDKNTSEKLERQLSFGGNQLEQVMQKINTPKNKQDINSKFQPSYQKPQSNNNDLHFNYNDSNYGGSSDGSSAIFFTSQFREFINQAKPAGEPEKQAEVRPITLQEPSHSSQSQPAKKPQNSSQQANNTHSNAHNNTHTQKQIGQSFLKLGQQQFSQSNSQSRGALNHNPNANPNPTDFLNKKLQHNQSGRSLAFSNNDQSLFLRDSKANQSVSINIGNNNAQYQHYQDIVNRKLDQELVLEIQHFGKNWFREFVQKYYKVKKQTQDQYICKQTSKQLRLLSKLLKFKEMCQKQLKRYCFDGFIVLKQFKFEQMKGQIKADNFIKQSNQKLLKQMFLSWKNIGLQQQKNIIKFHDRNNEKMKKNIFQVFRMIWFDSKVKHQVDMYYLSKLFSAWKTAASAQRKKSENQALKQYCRSLKRLHFYKLIEGVEATRNQRLNQELATEHYRGCTIKKYFDAWLEQCDRSPQYVSLTMTSKNVFKQTLDNKWLGIKTVDFKQIKR